MANKLQFVYIARPGDKEAYQKFKAEFDVMSKEKLIESYNKTVEVGIVGVHMQGLSILALHKRFEEVFRKSPILIEEGIIISLTGPIVQKGDSWEYLQGGGKVVPFNLN